MLCAFLTYNLESLNDASNRQESSTLVMTPEVATQVMRCRAKLQYRTQEYNSLLGVRLLEVAVLVRVTCVVCEQLLAVVPSILL
jgi:hypothetical protein